jgi:hypothetical protein
MESRRVAYRKFSQYVRKFDPDRLLEKIAQVSAELERAQFGREPARWPDNGPIQQFSLALVARTAILDGANRRKRRPGRPVTDRELHYLCAQSIEVDHADVPTRGILDDRALTRMMARLIYHQGLFGYSNFENIARTLGLLVDHDPDVRGLPTQSEWENALGVSLPAYTAIMFHLAAAVNSGNGWLTMDAIQAGVDAGAFAGADLETVSTIVRNELSADVRALRDLGSQHQLAGAEMWSFNPLMAKPLISYGDRHLLPVHDYLIQKMTSLGLYFTGIDHFGDDFPRALGDSFEKYVGRHLALLEAAGATVYPEVTYGRDKKKTVDYIVVLDEVVLLIEVKGMRANALAKAGVDAGLEQLVGRIQKARDQIDKTAGLIEDRITELDFIPAGREIRGLVVTMEPVHQIDTFLYRDMFKDNTIESATAGAHDLERICPTLATASRPGARILDALTFNDPTPASLARAIEGLVPVRNPVLDELWDGWKDLLPTQPVPSENYYRRASPPALSVGQR